MPRLQREGLVGGVLELATPTTYEASWQIPGDNGVPIDHYLIAYHMVRADALLKTLQGKSHLCIPLLGIALPLPQFPHSRRCERFI
jgi:hypothetical protein